MTTPRRSRTTRDTTPPQAAPAPVVRLSGVDKVFSRGDQPSTIALEGIDLEIGR